MISDIFCESTDSKNNIKLIIRKLVALRTAILIAGDRNRLKKAILVNDDSLSRNCLIDKCIKK